MSIQWVNYSMKKLLLIALLFVGCTQNMAKLSLVSTSDYDLRTQYQSVGSISGEDKVYIIIAFPMGTPRIDDAINDALQKNNANFMTNASIDYTTIYIPYIGGFFKYSVIGEGWTSIQNSNETLNNQKNIILKFDPETGEPIPE